MYLSEIFLRAPYNFVISANVFSVSSKPVVINKFSQCVTLFITISLEVLSECRSQRHRFIL